MASSVRDWVGQVTRRDPVRGLVLGYASYVLIGWAILSLPICHGRPIGALDALFTSTSAVSTTGLVTVSTGHDFNGLGQLVILLLFQLGGLGYMTFGSFVMLSRRHALDQRRKDLARTVFTLPEGFAILRFLRNVVTFTVVIESIGAVLLTILFARAGAPAPLWQGTFHSVSAFCTAGFSLFDDSLEAFRDDVGINLTIGCLSILGALGFIVFTDLWDVVRRRKDKVTLTTRVIFHAMFWLLLVGMLAILFCDRSIAALPAGDRLLAAWFQAMTALTTVGFDTVPTNHVSMAGITIIVTLMVIGGSPSGTGGGVKVTTVSALFAVVRSALRRSVSVQFFGREVPIARVLAATAALTVYASVLGIGTFLLTLTEDHPFEDLMFEATSALGTVGLSRGITPELTPLGKLIVAAVMFFGRVGPLTIAAAVFSAPFAEGEGTKDEPIGDAAAAPTDAVASGEETAADVAEEQEQREREPQSPSPDGEPPPEQEDVAM